MNKIHNKFLIGFLFLLGIILVPTDKVGATPTVVVTASPQTIYSGGTTTITWTAIGATTCKRSDTGATIATSGSFSSGVLTATKTFTIICSASPLITQISNIASGGIRQQAFRIDNINDQDSLEAVETTMYNIYMTISPTSGYTPESIAVALANKWNSMSDSYWCEHISILYNSAPPSCATLLVAKPTAIASGNTLTLMNNYTNLLSLPRDGQFSARAYIVGSL